jgi:hypothetical protein
MFRVMWWASKISNSSLFLGWCLRLPQWIHWTWTDWWTPYAPWKAMWNWLREALRMPKVCSEKIP